MTRYAQNGGLTRFDTGSTHELNPNGGIDIGNNNSVEENETKQNDFVYSNRIFLDSDIVSQYNLPKSLVGKSVADATKMIDDKFKGRNDKISQSTKNGMLSKIAEAQEAMKPQEPEMVPQEDIMDQSPEMIDDPSQMALGGYINRQMNNGGWYDQNNPYFMNNPGVQQPGIGPINQIQPVNQLSQANSLSQIKPFTTNNQLSTAGANGMSSMAAMSADAVMPGMGELIKAGQAVTGGIGNIASSLMSKSKIDTSGIAPNTKIASSGDVLKQGPVNTISDPSPSGIIKTLFTTGAGLITAGKDKKAAAENINNYAINTNKKFSDNYFAYGGEINPPIQNKETWNTKKIVKYQPGVTSGKNGDAGFYLYSKDPTQQGFNPQRDREFIRQENMMDLQRTPQWKEYMTTQKYIQPTTKFAMGGKINQMGDGGYYDKNNPYFMKNPGLINPTTVNMGPISNPDNINEILKVRQNLYPQSIQNLKSNNSITDSSVLKQYNSDVLNPGLFDTQKVLDGDRYSFENRLKRAGKTINNNAGNIARYAPIAANALQLSQLKKPQGESLDRLGNRYKPEYVDEANLQNIASQTMNNSVNAIGQSGASQGQLRAAILGSQLGRTKALSDAYSQAAAQNRATNDRAQTFNADIDRVNLNQSNNEKDINARDQAAYRNAKREYITGIGEGIGGIGDEQAYKKIAKNTTGYTWDGTYVKTPDGNIVTNPATGKPMTQEELKQSQASKDKKALGGYLIKNRIK